MNIILRAGERLWSFEGTHVWDEKGFAILAQEDTEIVVDDSVANEVLGFIRDDRIFRGVDADTGLPIPEPEPVVEPEPTPEPVVEPEVLPEVTPAPEGETPNV